MAQSSIDSVTCRASSFLQSRRVDNHRQAAQTGVFDRMERSGRPDSTRLEPFRCTPRKVDSYLKIFFLNRAREIFQSLLLKSGFDIRPAYQPLRRSG
jgi:hypothetical protein